MTSLAPLVAGCALAAIGLGGLLLLPSLLRKLIAFNVMGGGVFLLLIALAPRTSDGSADPIAQALVLTGIVIAIAATALGLGLARLYRAATGRNSLAESAPGDDD
jgi:multicomponent Na+:H+ antiporter subunit C